MRKTDRFVQRQGDDEGDEEGGEEREASGGHPRRTEGPRKVSTLAGFEFVDPTTRQTDKPIAKSLLHWIIVRPAQNASLHA
jgi:hypothetical protein